MSKEFDARPIPTGDYSGGTVDRQPRPSQQPERYSRRDKIWAGLLAAAGVLAFVAVTSQRASSHEGSNELVPGQITCGDTQTVEVPKGATFSELIEDNVDREGIDDEDFPGLVANITLNEEAIKDDKPFTFDLNVDTFVIPHEVTEGKPVNLPGWCQPIPPPEQ